jgi:hypothetical protein
LHEEAVRGARELLAELEADRQAEAARRRGERCVRHEDRLEACNVEFSLA